MTYLSVTQICLTVLVGIAALTDLRSRRIPNWLTFGGVLGGLLLQTFTNGLGGLKTSATGMMLGFGAYLVLYCLRAMGAGDVKLMAALGAILGPANWIAVFVATSIAAGVLAMGLIVVKGRTRITLWNTWFIVVELLHLRLPFTRRADLDVRDSRALNMPHAVAIAVGTMICILSARMGHGGIPGR